MTDPIISFSNVNYTYQSSDTPALRNVDLTIERGEYVAILGLNGSGKTTLGLCVNGVIPSMLGGELSGEITVGGLRVADYPVREMAKIVGMVFDNPEFQMSQLTVAEEISLGLENSGVPRAEMLRIIPEVLATVGLSGYEQHSPLALSGGQQQRLAIAAVLAMKPQVLIMDEPTSNLDPSGKQEVFGMAATLNREQNMTVLVIEHEVEVMARYAHRVIVLDKGQVVMNGTPEDIFAKVHELNARKLRGPQAAEFAYRLRERGLWLEIIPTRTETAIEMLRELLGDIRG